MTTIDPSDPGILALLVLVTMLWTWITTFVLITYRLNDLFHWCLNWAFLIGELVLVCATAYSAFFCVLNQIVPTTR